MNTENLEAKELNNLNPRVSKVKIGIRNLREIAIYPLSARDELNLSELISKAILSFYEQYNKKKKKVDSELNEQARSTGISSIIDTEIDDVKTEDMEFISFVVDLIKTNLEKILRLVTDEYKDETVDLLAEIDNFQVVEVVQAIYKNNFEEVAKNARSLFEKVTDLFLSERPLPESSKDMDIPFKMSLESPLKKED